MQEPEEEIFEEIRAQTILEVKGLLPSVCDEFDLHASSEFNAVTIRISGALQSDLNWHAAKEQAEKAIAKGLALFWDIDLGLFDYLTLPLGNQTQFLSLGLSLDYFRDTLWKDFAHHSLGLSIFRGSADFSLKFKWDDDQINNLQEWLKEHFLNQEKFVEIVGRIDIEKVEPDDLLQTQWGRSILALFCRDVCVEYLAMLSARLPDSMLCYLFLDATSMSSEPLKQLQLLNPDRYDFLRLALKGVTLPFKAWGWQSAALSEGYSGIIPRKIPNRKEIAVGICLPLMNYYHPSHWQDFDRALATFIENSASIRLIAESHLITQWDGLDALLYNPKGLSSQGKRKLQGFCAAGGLAVSLGELLGLPHEIKFSDWIENHF